MGMTKPGLASTGVAGVLGDAGVPGWANADTLSQPIEASSALWDTSLLNRKYFMENP
jgi:hypothetical protein